jgi:hypothetical protein
MPEYPDRQIVDWDRVFEDGAQLDEAIRRGVREALLRHKMLRQPIVVWRDSRSTWIEPDDIEVVPSSLNFGTAPFPLSIEEKTN